MNCLKNQTSPIVHLKCYCHGCEKFHDDFIHPLQMVSSMESWNYKHAKPTCRTEFVKMRHRLPRPQWLRRFEKLVTLAKNALFPWYLDTAMYAENNNYQLAFTASAALTCTNLASLAADATALAGASTAVVDNTASGTLLDLALTAVLKMGGTAPTAGGILYIYPWAKIDDSTYPDQISGSDALITMTSTNVLQTAFPAARTATVDNTGGANRLYYFAPTGLGSFFGIVPRYWGAWIDNNTTQNLASSGSTITQKNSYVSG